MENQKQAPVLSVKDWFINLIIAAIPLLGIIMLFVWAFSSSENENKSNWAKAALIIAAILFVVTTLLFALLLEAIKRFH